ncbi:MAG: hypothetical protein H6649_06070 [Caldilineae bacterium]|nr:hypothetical protein [Caldilineae bacterium]
MAVERQDTAAVSETVLDDDDPLVAAPAQRLGVGDPAMADAVDRRTEVRPAQQAPVLAGVLPGRPAAASKALNKIGVIGQRRGDRKSSVSTRPHGAPSVARARLPLADAARWKPGWAARLP